MGSTEPSNLTPSEMLRLNMDTPLCGTGGAPACSRLGVIAGDVQGFPNGRRLSDDTIDIALRVARGCLLPSHDAAADTLGDGVDANDVAVPVDVPVRRVSAQRLGPEPALSPESRRGGR